MSVRSTLWTAAAVASLVAVPALGVAAATSAAADSGASPSAGSSAQRLTRACERIPQRIDRLQRLQTRFHADAGTRGSIAFLSARIERATADGHADLARVLGDRLAVRKDIDSQLPDVLAKLRDAQQVCAEHAPSTSSAPAAKASS